MKLEKRELLRSSSVIQREGFWLVQVSGRRCGVDVDEAAVVDGEEAHREDFPWEVDIYLQEGLNFTRLWTGVLVEPTMVVARKLYFIILF